jgi:hypothetical protein
MHDVLLFSLQLVLGIVVPAYVVRRDIRRLPPAVRERAWPDHSVWIGVALISSFAVILHFARTRRTLAGFGLGLLWFAGCLAVILAVVSFFDLILP